MAPSFCSAANDNTFGLCAGVFTKNVPKGIRMANAIRAGSLWVNDYGSLPSEWPWGGFRESGFGKENSVIGLDSYTQIKAVSIDFDIPGMQAPPAADIPDTRPLALFCRKLSLYR
jgi:acyl-CoA reductase-like NAD-dependent aldehyde dehydrogenase